MFKLGPPQPIPVMLPPEEKEPEFSNELDYLEWVWRNPDKPDRLRYMAAKACANFHYPTMKAVAHVTNKDSMAAILDRARERAASVSDPLGGLAAEGPST